MPNSAIASRYASALVDVVTGNSPGVDPQRLIQELRSFEEMLASSAELQTALASPAVTLARKKAVIARLAEMLSLSRISRNFLFVLVDHRRTGTLSEIIDSYETLLDERLGFVQADVRSASEMEEQQRAALIAELSRLTGKKVRLRFSVDSGMIGGVVARIGSSVYDGSVRGQLELLGRRLRAE